MLAVNGATRGVGLNLGPVLFRRVHAVLGGRMRVMVTGGSRFDPAIGADLFRLGFNILQGYGLTETSGAATLTRPNDPALETVGQPLPGNEVRIAAPEAGADAEGGADGEILIRGPIVMRGYFNRPDATAAALRDGWLHTGDLGRLDAEGRLSITGRKKELIVLSSGKNIYPEEIEAVYRKSAFIKELCVLGLARPGEPAAERLYAVVVPDDQVLRERKIANVGDIIRFEMEGASVNLPHHKRVLGYEIWMDALPRTSTGKIKRFEIERRVKSGAEARRDPAGPVLGEADRAFLERLDLQPILATIRQAARPGAIVTPDANLELDLGLDSMERVELLTALEQQVGADIPDAELQRLYTVRELAESLVEHAREGGGATAPASWATLLAPEAADHDAFREWLQPHWLVPGLLFVALKLVRLLLRPGVKVTIEGVQHFPATGPYLICPNHQSYLDPFFVHGRAAVSAGASDVLRRRQRVLRDVGHPVARATGEPGAGRSGCGAGVGDAGRRGRTARGQDPGAVPRGRACHRRHRAELQEGRGHPRPSPADAPGARGADRRLRDLAAQPAAQLARAAARGRLGRAPARGPARRARRRQHRRGDVCRLDRAPAGRCRVDVCGLNSALIGMVQIAG